MTQTIFKTKIAPEKTIATCASCPKFKDSGEGRGRGLCSVFDTIVFSHHPFTQDCRLNFSSKSREKTIDSVGKQIQETRFRLEKSKHRLSIKNQLVLKAPF
ncbi:MAG: hypothetical protein QNJ32_29580 [Xenococcaceae cyanobacterium MO_167.B27]|nr:hypothetical protein [Xenococcaceae cyanobacterium MO_167.B27]